MFLYIFNLDYMDFKCYLLFFKSINLIDNLPFISYFFNKIIIMVLLSFFICKILYHFVYIILNFNEKRIRYKNLFVCSSLMMVFILSSKNFIKWFIYSLLNIFRLSLNYFYYWSDFVTFIFIFCKLVLCPPMKVFNVNYF